MCISVCISMSHARTRCECIAVILWPSHTRFLAVQLLYVPRPRRPVVCRRTSYSQALTCLSKNGRYTSVVQATSTRLKCLHNILEADRDYLAGPGRVEYSLADLERSVHMSRCSRLPFLNTPSSGSTTTTFAVTPTLDEWPNPKG